MRVLLIKGLAMNKTKVKTSNRSQVKRLGIRERWIPVRHVQKESDVVLCVMCATSICGTCLQVKCVTPKIANNFECR